MSKEKSPAYQHYPKDILSDINYQMMTWEERGIYRHLMDVCWLEMSLPADLEELTALCGGTAPTPRVLKCFHRSAIAEGSQSDRLIHQRLEKERQKQGEFRARKSLAGKKGNKARWGKRKKTKKIIASGSQCDRKAIAEASQTIALQSSISSLPSASEITPPIDPPGGNGKPKKSHRAPEGFRPTEEMRGLMKIEIPGLDLDSETTKFMDHEFDKPKTDWNAAWRNWMRNALKYGAVPKEPKPQQTRVDWSATEARNESSPMAAKDSGGK